MLALLALEALIVIVQNAVLAVVPRRILRGPAQRVVSQYRTHGIADQAHLTVEAATLLAAHEFLVNLIGAVYHLGHRLVVLRGGCGQQRDCPNWYCVVGNLRRVHARRRDVKAVRAETERKTC